MARKLIKTADIEAMTEPLPRKEAAKKIRKKKEKKDEPVHCRYCKKQVHRNTVLHHLNNIG